MPVPAGEPEATRVPEAGSAAATEERVANGACAIAAPTPGTPDRQAIRATSLPAPAAESTRTPVHPKGTMVIPMLWRISEYVVCMMGVKNQNHHTHPYSKA